MRFLRKRTLILGLLWLTGTAQADTTVKQLAPGVTLTQEIDQKTPLIINVVSVDLDAPGVRIGVGVGQDKISAPDATQGREDVSRLARRWGALAAVNADYFPYTGDPLGVGIREGELFSEPFPGIRGSGPRVTLGVTPDGKSILFDTLGFLGDLQASDGARSFVSGIDRSTAPNEIIVYSPIYGQTTSNKPGGVEAVITGVNLPIRANKLLTGHIERVESVQSTTETIPAGGVVISGGPGTGANFLAQHLHPGDPVSFALAVAPVGQTQNALQIASLPRTGNDLPSRSGEGLSRSAFVWAQVPSAVGGGPRLLVDGQVAVDWAAEGFDAGFAGSLNPRTAVGTSRDGRRLFLVTVDGRQAFSKGVSLASLALILKRYGAWNAINFDGGGSTTMAVGGLTVSSPGGTGSERPVADMLLVYSDRALQTDAPALPTLTGEAEAGQDDTPPAQIVLPKSALRVGIAIPLRLQEGTRTLPGSTPGILWQGPVSGGIGFVNQKGYLITTAPGSGTVSAFYKGKLLTVLVTVIGKAAPLSVYTLQCRLAPDPDGLHDRSQLVIRITDQNGKPLASASAAIRVTLGTADQQTLQTDRDGTATVGITWAAETGGSVIITSGALAPVTSTRL
ncbi:MAG: phosphodiester glycosidase family protein [Janthinobacterium lividum]